MYVRIGILFRQTLELDWLNAEGCVEFEMDLLRVGIIGIVFIECLFEEDEFGFHMCTILLLEDFAVFSYFFLQILDEILHRLALILQIEYHLLRVLVFPHKLYDSQHDPLQELGIFEGDELYFDGLVLFDNPVD